MKKLIVAVGFLVLTLFSKQLFSDDLETGLDNQTLFAHKKILILGGTGFLGRALIEELSKYEPSEIVVYSRDEVKHFNLTKIFPHNTKIRSVFGDIRDYDHLLQVTKDIDYVFHLAALKRIDDLELNVQEGIKTNILGSLNVFNACVANGVKKVLFISTDKACSPVNAYGASKFISEKIFTNYDRSRIKTVFLATRYGNILDSTGSIIPIFSEKIKKGEELTLTDPRMTRFVIDKTDAIKLILDAFRYGVGGEVFVRKLPSTKISDLIDVLKKHFNATNHVRVTGLRPGEKIHEILINRAEVPRVIVFNDYFIITPSIENGEAPTTPVYAKKGVRLSEDVMTGFSSKDALVTQEALEGILKQAKLM